MTEPTAMTQVQPRPVGADVDVSARPNVVGKFLYSGGTKLFVKGVTYGPFGSGDEDRAEYDPDATERDFADMAASGINSVRVYTVPPVWLLDSAARNGLRVMVGIPWEQHVTFLDDRHRADAIERRVREGVRACAGHPGVLCFSIGNEIPAPVVRWHGRRTVERFIERLYRAAKAEDPEAIVTYVNFPSTEYLQLSFLDLVCFNVYLEQRERLEAYMARLQNLADEQPLLMAEIGLDSRRNGEDEQAHTLDWQLRTVFGAGAAGAFVFAWTDEWHRGGHEITDWDFGLTTRDRRPKPALGAVADAFRALPRELVRSPPRISVLICSYNGSATLGDCLEAVMQIDYPDYDVIVVSDGSTDATADIARAHGAKVIETANEGLAAARNTALAAASGEIVAYIDDDARPDPDWLTFVAHAFRTTGYAAIGGPNVPWPGANEVAQCVGNAPGGPTHVLVSDTDAEHIPGCNMAVRRSALESVNGFDPQFRAAGDDVDLCWRLLDAGERIGFAPGAAVLHHRRREIKAYIAQQRGYGRAEALLERKWPQKYSPGGHVTWGGRLYGNGSAQHRGGWRWRIYYGGWGTGLFQSIYGPRRGLLESLPLMPEWYLAIAALAGLSAAGALWRPLLLFVPLLTLAVAALLFDAGVGAARASFPGAPAGRERFRLRALTAALYLLQPLARLYGRLAEGLAPWRRRGPARFALPRPQAAAFWSERWRPLEERVGALQEALREDGPVVDAGGDWDRWDLSVRGGPLGASRLRVAIEEHGEGRQLVRVRWWPYVPRAGVLFGAVALAFALGAYVSDAMTAARGFGIVALLLILRVVYECGAAAATVRIVLRRPPEARARAIADLAPIDPG